MRKILNKWFPKKAFSKPQFGFLHRIRLYLHCREKGHHMKGEVAAEAKSTSRWYWCRECHDKHWGNGVVPTGSQIHASECILSGVRGHAIADRSGSVSMELGHPTMGSYEPTIREPELAKP